MRWSYTWIRFLIKTVCGLVLFWSRFDDFVKQRNRKTERERERTFNKYKRKRGEASRQRIEDVYGATWQYTMNTDLIWWWDQKRGTHNLRSWFIWSDQNSSERVDDPFGSNSKPHLSLYEGKKIRDKENFKRKNVIVKIFIYNFSLSLSKKEKKCDKERIYEKWKDGVFQDLEKN